MEIYTWIEQYNLPAAHGGARARRFHYVQKGAAKTLCGKSTAGMRQIPPEFESQPPDLGSDGIMCTECVEAVENPGLPM
jgi:hypothetical protein